uniref:Zinc finger CCCH domain-containing protein 11A n=1 Tax=Caligus rogercresseyi TaxID=217165 RepID=C1BN21_CALRO|nr:Zinc finger CCCH domain-containing protein 11A [Caligus rogercresseyi]
MEDCYFFYDSECSKGPSCPFRHEPLALHSGVVCSFWRRGNCSKLPCHTDMQNRLHRPPVSPPFPATGNLNLGDVVRPAAPSFTRVQPFLQAPLPGPKSSSTRQRSMRSELSLHKKWRQSGSSSLPAPESP